MWVFKNHIPTVSANKTIITDKNTCILNEVEKTRFKASTSPLPNSKVRKRLAEEDKEENTEQLEEEITSNSSNSILYVEIFCGIIGVIMLILASKTTN